MIKPIFALGVIGLLTCVEFSFGSPPIDDWKFDPDEELNTVSNIFNSHPYSEYM